MTRKSKEQAKSVLGFLFPKKNDKENIFQYLLRQLYVSDSAGRPSLTVTILMFVMSIVGVVTFVEIKNAITMVKYFDGAGKIIKIAPHGFSDLFMYLVIGLSIVITGWYRQRQNKVFSNEPGEVLPSETAIEKAKTFINGIVGPR